MKKTLSILSMHDFNQFALDKKLPKESIDYATLFLVSHLCEENCVAPTSIGINPKGNVTIGWNYTHHFLSLSFLENGEIDFIYFHTTNNLKRRGRIRLDNISTKFSALIKNFK